MRKALFLVSGFLLLLCFLAVSPVSAVQNYESGFESDGTGSMPGEWSHYQDRNYGYCSGSGCEVGYSEVVSDRSSSGSKSLECLERSNGKRHCYLPIDVPSSSDEASVSFDYLLAVNGQWTNSVICINDDSMFQDSNTGMCNEIRAIDQDWDSSTTTEGWSSINNYDISQHAGDTVYLDLVIDGRHSGNLGAWSRATVDDVDVNVEVNYPPNVGSPEPAESSGSGTIDDRDAQLKAYISGENGESIDVDFYQGNPGSGRVGGDQVNEQGTATASWDNLQCGHQYSWSVQATDDGGKTGTGGPWSFSVNCPPPSPPTDASPSNANQVSIHPEISARYPEGETQGSLEFLDTSGNTIGSCNQLSAGERCTVEYDSATEYGQDYNFRVRAREASSGKTSGSIFGSFTTNYRPQVSDLSVEQLDSGHKISVGSTVRDENGEGDISSCELAVEGQNGQTYTESVNNPDGGSSGQDAVCNFGNVSYSDGTGWEHLEALDVSVTVEDSMGATGTVSEDTNFPDHEPEIANIESTNYQDRNVFTVSSTVNFPDNGEDEARSCTIILSDGDQSYSTGTMNRIDSSTVECVQEDIGPGQFPSFTVNDEIDITVRATDVHGSTGEASTRYNVPTGVTYQYSALIMQSGGVDFLPYRVTNAGDSETRYRTELENFNSSFTANDQSVKTYNISSGETATHRIRLTPNVSFSGTKQIQINTENLETGVTETSNFTVQVTESGGSTTTEVPGIGLIHIVTVLLIASTVFYRRKGL